MATQNTPTETMKLDRTDGSSTMELYRAALGPLRRDYYLKAFTRFDAAGKSGPSWNWVAALLTINWFAFRKLWAAALAYVGALVFFALLLLGIGRVLFHLDEAQIGILASLALAASIAIPGLYGNAWLYASLNQKIERALVDSATLEEACAMLSPDAGGRNRLAGLAAGNLALCAAAVAVVLSLPDSAKLPLNTSKIAEARVTPTAPTQSGLVTPSIVSSADTPAKAPVAATSAPVDEPGANAARISKGVIQQATVPAPNALVASVSAASAPVSSAPTTAVVPEVPLAKVAPPAAGKPPVEVKSPAAEKTPVAEKTTAEKKRAKEPHKKTVDKEASAPASDKYLINVGLFADSNNARNAIAKLKDEALPVITSTLKGAKGERTRVRVGPFDTQAEADRMVEKIQAMKLDAVVVKP